MSRFALPLVALGAAVATPAIAAEVQIAASGPVVELTVSETVAAAPDVVHLSAGVSTLAASAVEALRQNAEQMARVIARIEAAGVAEADIQTGGINLNPEYQWDDAAQQQRFRGYRVSSNVLVKLRDLPRTGQVLDALVTAGATDLGGISWSVEDPAPAQAQAREAAFRNAREQALAYARMAGYADVRLLEINEASFASVPMPLVLADAAAEARNATMPIRPGQVQTGVTITVKYEMTR